VAALTAPVLREYAKRHGYNLVEIVNATVHRSIVWDRFMHIASALDAGADVVAWFDADVLITNLHIRLENLANLRYEGFTLAEAVCEDGQPRLNDGVTIVTDPYGVLADTCRAIHTYPGAKGIYCGQDVLQAALDNDEVDPRQHIQTVIPIRTLPHKTLNSFLYTEYNMPETTPGHWTPGDFVLHLPGRTNERRVELFTDYSKHILR
jgi:hypothetical protein